MRNSLPQFMSSRVTVAALRVADTTPEKHAEKTSFDLYIWQASVQIAYSVRRNARRSLTIERQLSGSVYKTRNDEVPSARRYWLRSGRNKSAWADEFAGRIQPASSSASCAPRAFCLPPKRAYLLWFLSDLNH